MELRSVAAVLAGLLLAPSSLTTAMAAPAPSSSAETVVVGLWEPDFRAETPAADCEGWRLDTQGFCTADDSRNGVELGVKFQTSRDLLITGIRVYRVDLATITGSLWAADGSLLATGRFAPTDTRNWQDLTFSRPVAVSPDRTYVASYYSPATKYAFQYDFFRDEQLTRGPVTALRAVEGDPNGVHCYDVAACRSFPRSPYRSSTYWVSPLWESPAGEPLPPPAAPALPADAESPSVSTATPYGGATRVGTRASVKATFSEHVRAALLTRANVRLMRKGDPTPVRVRLRYDERRTRLVLDPARRLRRDATYRVLVNTRVADIAGNPLDQNPQKTGAQAAKWRFRTR